MTEALEEFVDLFSVESSAKSTAQRVAGQKLARRKIDRGLLNAREASTRRAWLDERHRPAPTLAKVNWLDRPDP